MVVEIYTRIYLRNAGAERKEVRTRADLKQALIGLGSKPARLRFGANDHQTDALVTAAGMRAHLHHNPLAFKPARASRPELARTEELDVRHRLTKIVDFSTDA